MDSTIGQHTCDRCHRLVQNGMGFVLRTSMGDVLKCLRCAMRHRPMLKRSVLAAVLVGTALTALNQGDVLIAGDGGSALYWKVPLTYLVPFVVATWGALTSARR